MNSSLPAILNDPKRPPPPDRGGLLLGVVSTFLVLTWVTVSLRFYVRVVLSHSVGADDFIMLAALLLFTIYSGFDIAGVHYGIGRHTTSATKENIQSSFQVWLYAELIYIITAMVTRISVAVFLLRVTVKRTHQIIIWVVIAISVIFNVFLFFYTLFQCAPVSYFWTRTVNPFNGGHCRNVNTDISVTYASSAFSGVADLVCALLPMAMLWDAQMTRRTKIGVMAILSMGAISGIAVLIRIPYVKSFRDSDFLYGGIDLAVWSDIEPGVGITAGSLATLRPLIRTAQEKWKTRNGPTTHPPTHSTRWKKSPDVNVGEPWSSDRPFSGSFNEAFRQGALSRDGLRMHPQEEIVSSEVICLKPIEERKGSRGFSDNSENEGEDCMDVGRWERGVDTPDDSDGEERAWERSLSPTSRSKINDGEDFK